MSCTILYKKGFYNNITDVAARWVPNTSIILAAGTGAVVVPLTPENWIRMSDGIPATSDLTNWNGVLGNLGQIGLVFGGGYSAGHGVFQKANSIGNAKFTVLDYVIQP